MVVGPSSRCAVLFVMHSSGSTHLEALWSFCNPCDVEACFVMDMSAIGGETHLTLPALRCPATVFAATPNQARSAGEALNELSRKAVLDGFTHAVVATSNDRLSRRHDGQMCERLPSGWQSCDVLQIASGAKHRPVIDALVRLSAVRFYGTLLPVPVPVMSTSPTVLVVRPWHDDAVVTSSRMLTSKQLRESINVMWERVSCVESESETGVQQHVDVHAADYHAFELTLFTTMLPETATDADMLLDDRMRHGIDGWCGSDGLYFAARLGASTAMPGGSCLMAHLLAAEIGLEQTPPRVEALHALATYIRKTADSPNVAGLLAAAAVGCPTTSSLWMGDVTSALYGIRDEVGVSAYGMLNETVRQRVSYPNLLACASMPAAEMEPRVRANYRYVAQLGDDSAARRACPGPVDALLPTIIVHDDFVLGLPHTGDLLYKDIAFDVPRGTRWSWLLTLYSNAAGAPSGLEWDDPPSRVNVMVDTTSQTYCAERGYVFVLPMSSGGGFDGTGALQLVRHAATGWSRMPCVEQAKTDGGGGCIASLLQADAVVPAAWRPSSTIELTHGRLVVLRAGCFYRYVAPPCLSGDGGVSLFVARTRLVLGDGDA